jgi:hypothetical protein
MFEKQNPARAGNAAGSRGSSVFADANPIGQSAPNRKPAAGSLHLVPKPPPRRRPPAYTARISVMACNVPHGRSRAFSLSPEALERLIEAAEELEKREAVVQRPRG